MGPANLDSDSQCDDTEFYCDGREGTSFVKLDDLLFNTNVPICLAKVDVEGAELRVLQGSAALLGKRRIKLLYFEWIPNQIRNNFREEPLELLWFLHKIGYNIYAPIDWFGRGPRWENL